MQTAEGELSVEIPQVREAAETFASKLFPRTPKLLRTEPLKALVIGAFVRGLSMRDVESLCEQAGLGKLSKSTASRICEELRERFAAFCRRSLYDVHLVALFLDATFISVRPSGPKEGVLVAWGFTDEGERVLLAVTLGMRESYEDWQALGRDLIARGLGAHDDPREVLASLREARELALSLALADANSEGYPWRCGGWRWWSRPTGGFPRGYDARRVEWRALRREPPLESRTLAAHRPPVVRRILNEIEPSSYRGGEH